MNRKRPLNDLGIWLMHELDCRNIHSKEFAERIPTTPQNLSDILHGDRFSPKTLQRWKTKFENALKVMDTKRGNAVGTNIIYQAICTSVTVESNSCITYGIQMLSSMAGHYRIVDEIQDISPNAEWILQLVNLFNQEKVSDVHFRDLIMDSL